MENLYILIAAFVSAVALGRMIIPNILIISLRKRLFDVPDERKVHKRPVPRLGGVTFFPVILFSLCVFTAVRLLTGHGPEEAKVDRLVCEFLFLMGGLTLLYIIGIGDDLVGVRYRRKFLVQILSAAMFPISGVYINCFYGLFGIYMVPAAVGIPLTMLLVVFITNAINLIDGIDGLASGLSMVALLVFGVLFVHYQMWSYAMLAFVTVGVIIPFFSYNVFGDADMGRKIFMGDTGSLTLGYILSFFVIRYCMYEPDMLLLTMKSSPVLVSFSVLMVPCLDVVRVVLRRARNKKPLFMPDKTHIHHKFLAMGFSPRKALVTIQLMSACFCVFTIVGIRYLNNTLVFVIDVVVWTLLNLWFNRVIRMKEGEKKNEE
ncbi:MraY family glycosyltransferase [Phocaeicola plebeius]|uniref:MraY family glycosyltransferase n=1 Tax=Phocaeicola plebeius TaxID=310297 RepID=UPI0026EE6BA1|nr:MraY family glycosyltransferase [Phocaeicola plebeius]